MSLDLTEYLDIKQKHNKEVILSGNWQVDPIQAAQINLVHIRANPLNLNVYSNAIGSLFDAALAAGFTVEEITRSMSKVQSTVLRKAPRLDYV